MTPRPQDVVLVPRWHGTAFQGPMVRAILEDAKWQTRRLATLSDRDRRCPSCKRLANLDEIYVDPRGFGGPVPVFKVPCRKCESTQRVWPKWSLGDMLWVREALHRDADDMPVYSATTSRIYGRTGRWPWKVRSLGARYCPAWASRITLRVERIRLERVHQISAKDVEAEGFRSAAVWAGYSIDPQDITTDAGRLATFRRVWNQIHPGANEQWRQPTRQNQLPRSPLVWVLDFVRAVRP